jgi:putative ABC transport system permease protein
MTLWTRVRSWLRAVLHRQRTETEMDAELRFHLDAYAEYLLRAGVSRDEAHRRACLEFGGLEQTKEHCRDATGTTFFDSLLQHLRFAVRMLRKSPGFTAVAILTLALGIGANTAIFSYVKEWLIKPLPYPDADRLVVLLSHDTKKGWTSKDVTSTADFLDYQRQSASFEQLACWTSWDYNLTGNGPPDRVPGGLVSWNFFLTLGAKPILGRAFLPQEGQPGSNRVAILSQGLWQSRFAADPHIIGRTVKLQGETYTVVGIMSADFLFPLMGIANVWSPMALDDKQRANRHSSWFQAVGRLRPGVSQEQAAAEIASIAAGLQKLYPGTNTNLTSLINPLAKAIGKNEGAEEVLIHFWVVGLVLLIACANVANLMLARTTIRGKEFAVRGALGASRGQIVRQLVTESLLLFSAGGVAGALFGMWSVRWIENLIPDRIRGYLVNYGRVDFDATTFAYALGIALLCGTAFGLVPALASSGIDFVRGLNESTQRVSGGRRPAQVLRIFVAAEIALAIVVLISTALLATSLAHMVYESRGFQSHNLLVTQTSIPPNKYSTPSQVRRFYDEVLARVRVLPGVLSAGAVQYLPFSGSNEVEHVHIVGRPPAELGEGRGAQFNAATADYFSTMQIPLLRGRLFDQRDAPDAPKVAVINEALAREQFPSKDPIGQQIEVPLLHLSWTIVGIVKDVKQFTLSDEPEPQLYASATQSPTVYMSIVARTARPDSQIAGAIRDGVWAVDAEQPIASIRNMDDLIAEQNTLMRVTTQIIGFFGGLALLLGAIGIYGVMAHSVGQRLREIGIRMALGANTGNVMRMVLRQGLKMALVGVALGVFAAVAVTRLLSAMLYKVTANDSVTFGLVALFFTFVALAACYLPARRAMKVDPVVALRYE